MSRRAHKPTEDTRTLVRRLAGLGVVVDDIASLTKISDETVRKYYREDIALGRAEANLGVARALYKAATREHQPNVVAQMFWLKNRAGWNDLSVGSGAGEGNTTVVIVTGVPRNEDVADATIAEERFTIEYDPGDEEDTTP
jgi:hypothetical protein